MFTGLNLTHLKKTYTIWEHGPGGLDDAPFIWKTLHDCGYSTLYAEDSTTGQIFSWAAAGFTNQPTDHYYHPFPLTLQNDIKFVWREDMYYCAGFNHSGEYVYKYGVDAAKLYHKKNPYYGISWSNNFSHDSWDLPAAMEMVIKRFIDDLKSSGFLDKSMMVIFSDHGIRFGELRARAVNKCLREISFK
jgi:hypothetical protein